ncbi:hypothetical protein BH10ACT1_BH10ACT1_40990 [soil metagenome]
MVHLDDELVAGTRIAFAITKRVGGAVVSHQIRRRVRES